MVRPQEVTAVPFWNTYTYLVEEIERCISRNDWNNLTRLLIALADGPKTYQPFLLKVNISYLRNKKCKYIFIYEEVVLGRATCICSYVTH